MNRARAIASLFLLLVIGGHANGWAAKAVPWMHVKVQAVRVSDDDGSRSCDITGPEIVQWINFTNRVFAPARIRFLFDPQKDIADARSSILNRINGVEDRNWTEAKAAGNRVAARYPGRMAVLFRFGPGEQPSGNGFSWTDYAFIVMSGFKSSSHCGHPHTDALAHEIGHHLGLPHTFPTPFATVEEAAKSFRGDPAVFDGDGFVDTPPDPAIRTLECDRRLSVTLNGATFPLPRRNIMSYYDERDSLTDEQIARVRWTLAFRTRHRMGVPANSGVAGAIEAEDMARVASEPHHAAIQDMAPWDGSAWSKGKQLFCDTGKGGGVSLRLMAPASGRYRLTLYATHAPDFGVIQASVDGIAQGQPFDAWAPFVTPSGAVSLGNLHLSEGSHVLRFEAVSKSALSSGYRFGLDGVTLEPLPEP